MNTAQMKDLIAELRNHPVAVAVEPVRQHAMESAAKWAQSYIDRAVVQLEEAGWDLNVAAPAPRGTMRRNEYIAAAAKRDVFNRFTTWTKSSRCPSEPNIVRYDEEGAKRFIDSAEQDASYAYDAFIAKLVAKIHIIGDYGVVNGTYREEWLECCHCGQRRHADECDIPDYDDYY